jgi:hypothetical protein
VIRVTSAKELVDDQPKGVLQDGVSVTFSTSGAFERISKPRLRPGILARDRTSSHVKGQHVVKLIRYGTDWDVTANNGNHLPDYENWLLPLDLGYWTFRRICDGQSLSVVTVRVRTHHITLSGRPLPVDYLGRHPQGGAHTLALAHPAEHR